MSHRIASGLWILLTFTPSMTQAQEAAKEITAIDVTVCRVVAHPERFSGKRVRIRASVLSDGLERTALIDPRCKLGIVPQIPSEVRGRPDIQAFEDAIFGPNPGTSTKRIAAVFTGVISWKSNVTALQIQEIADLEVSTSKKH